MLKGVGKVRLEGVDDDCPFLTSMEKMFDRDWESRPLVSELLLNPIFWEEEGKVLEVPDTPKRAMSYFSAMPKSGSKEGSVASVKKSSFA
jgi:hypothetical protein